MSIDKASMKVTLLGTGTSTGIPVIGCECEACTSADPRDKRLRCSCFVEIDGVNLLIDAGPDLRTQALNAKLTKVDAVLITHHHFDHVVGLDDLRPFFFGNREPIPCFANQDTAKILSKMFDYIFEDGSYPGVSKLTMHSVEEAFEVQSRYDSGKSATVIPIHAMHGSTPVLGFRIGDFAYLTDTSYIPEDQYPLLENLEVLVLDALRHEPHRSHYTIAEATEMAGILKPKQTYFTHMTHSIVHEIEEAKLPENVALAYDGLEITL